MRASHYLGHNPSLSYIYIWFSRKESVVYVGQTNDRYGVIGRAFQHLSPNGSLRARLLDNGYELDLIDDFLLLSYALPNNWRYTGLESSGREAVEYFVQVGIRDKQFLFDHYLLLVSTVRPANYFDYAEAEDLAKAIVDDFVEVYGA